MEKVMFKRRFTEEQRVKYVKRSLKIIKKTCWHKGYTVLR